MCRSSQQRLFDVIRIVKRTTKISQSSGPIYLVAYETVYMEWGDRMERVATTASSLEAEQDSEAQTRFEAASKQSNNPPLSRVNTLGSGEDNMKLNELMELCTKLSDSMNLVPNSLLDVLAIGDKKTTQSYGDSQVGSTRRVESSNDESLGAQEYTSKQERCIEDIDKDDEVSLVDETQGRSDDTEMFDTDALIVSTAAPSTIAVSPPVIIEVEITLGQTLAELKSAKSKVVITDQAWTSESFEDFTKRFNNETMKIPSLSNEHMIRAFNYGTVKDEFSEELGRRPPKTWKECLELA
ncbi:hypothetical protein Tco_0414323 [Tanacetum coccineum]